MNLGFLNDDSIFLIPTPWPKLKKRINKLLERNARFIVRVERQKDKSAAKVQAEQRTSINNSKNIPVKATIRQEYIKCGKSDCPNVKHGPYFYAYWKDDKGKLRKKYIGKYAQVGMNTAKDRPIDKDHASNYNISNNSKEV